MWIPTPTCVILIRNLPFFNIYFIRCMYQLCSGSFILGIEYNSPIFISHCIWGKKVPVMPAIHYVLTTMKKVRKCEKIQNVNNVWDMIHHIRLVCEKVFSYFVFHHEPLDWVVFCPNIKGIFCIVWEVSQNSDELWIVYCDCSVVICSLSFFCQISCIFFCGGSGNSV